MAGHLLAAQQLGGWWGHRFDQPAEVWGEGMKGTALWCWLFYELHRQSGDPQHLAAARRALGWLLDRQNFGDDSRARGGLVAVSPHSAVGIRPWFRVSSTYGAAFFGLAVLEELRLQERTAPVISGAIAGSFSTKTAIIRWTTGVAADGRVSYGTSTAYRALT
ncbi:MAG: hypothetical protein Q7K29_03450 [Thermoleophilia bacterium]|nr:hypothetical protein [Thermoleophilia bacterium]